MQLLKWTLRFLRFTRKRNKVCLSGEVSQIHRFCPISKRINEYSFQILTLNFTKGASPAFSESLKGVVMQNFSGTTPQIPHFGNAGSAAELFIHYNFSILFRLFKQSIFSQDTSSLDSKSLYQLVWCVVKSQFFYKPQSKRRWLVILFGPFKGGGTLRRALAVITTG